MSKFDEAMRAYSKEVEKVLHVTPIGVAKFPYLNKPDTKFKSEGEYKTGLVLTGKEAQTLKKMIDSAIEDAVTFAAKEKGEEVTAGAKHYKVVIDKETGKPNGEIRFNFKQKAVIQTKKGPWEKKPLILDTKNQVVPSTLNIGSGSEIRVAFNVSPYSTPIGTSVSLRLAQVQLHKFVEFTGGTDPDESAFEATEGGFVAESFEFGSGPTVEDDTDIAVAKSASGDF